MYLSNIKLWNFRKFGSNGDIDLENPDLDLSFTNGMNVLIGENDSGKSAIIDAIKLVLKTHSYEWIRVEDDDFFMDTTRLRIELKFDDLKDEEAKNFTEWLGWKGEGEEAMPFLRLIYDISRKEDRILPSDVRAGVDDEGYILNAEAREYLKATYLKPLRDALSELIPKKYSRLSQILSGHEAFLNKGDDHYLVGKSKILDDTIEKYFEGKKVNDDGIEEELTDDQNGKSLKKEIDSYIRSFYNTSADTQIDVLKGGLKQILEKLELKLRDEINPGLGTLNRLFMAAELLHLKKTNWDGLRLGLIEELEAHLHPQVQLRVIESLSNQKNIQLILTTHSPNLASKVKLENLIITNNCNAYPMGKDYTKLEEPDYLFLERFLDVTKANLFFAKGVILVEGWAEEILIPVISQKIGFDLIENGVSIVNIGSIAFTRYARIFQREESPYLDIPVAVVTDLDILPDDENIPEQDGTTGKDRKIHDKEEKYNGQSVKAFISPHWTLEYCIALTNDPFRELFFNTVKSIRGGGLSQSFGVFLDQNEEDKQFAKSLYQDQIIRPKISKPELAHKFSRAILEDSSINRELLESQNSIKYLIDAIKYACGNKDN